MVAGAKHDGLLMRVIFAMHQQPFKQVLAHGLDALRQNQFLFQRRTFIALGHGIGRDGLAGEGVGELFSGKIGTQHAAHALRLCAPVVEQIPGFNFRRGKIAVANALQIGVFVNRLAEVFEIVGKTAGGRFEFPAWSVRRPFPAI